MSIAHLFARLAIAACALVGCAHAAFTPPERITVVSDGNYPPYLFRDGDGQLQGIVKEKWELWSRRTGIPVRLLGLDWMAAQQRVRNGEADIVDAIAYTEERARQFNFAPTTSRVEARVFFHRSLSAINGVESLRGLPVGAKEGSACAEWLRERGLDSIRNYPRSEMLVKAAVAGELRIFCMDASAARYFLFKHAPADEFLESAPLYSTRLDWATGPGRVELRDFVQSGFRRIPEDELREIDARWLGSPLRYPIGDRYMLILAVFAAVTLGGAVLLLSWNAVLRHRARYVATRDLLTDLPNRDALAEHLARAIAGAGNGFHVAVLFIDLDRFKAMNNAFGRAFGDRLLKEVAERLRHCVAAPGMVARVSSDEFVLVPSLMSRPEDAATIARCVLSELHSGFDLDGQRVYCTASVGIAVHPGDGTAAAELVQNADIAMARAKRRGRNTFQFFLPEMQELEARRLKLETALHRALEQEEFLLLYQPRISLPSGSVCGFEALLRWRHPELGVLSPAEFIPILEETGLIVRVGEWAVRTVCRQIRSWESRGLRPRPIAVNLSARQFRQSNLDVIIARIIAEVGIDPALLELELTESSLMHDPDDAVRMMRQLESYGVRLAVDDFGTGYSSLAYLKRFPLDALKIDRGFVRDATHDPADAAITISIIQLAHNLGLRVVAEGVETAAQRDFLLANGCNEMQGYLFSPPISADATDAWVKDP